MDVDKSYIPKNKSIQSLVDEVMHPKKPDSEKLEYWEMLKGRADILFHSKDVSCRDKLYLQLSGAMEMLYMTTTSFED